MIHNNKESFLVSIIVPCYNQAEYLSDSLGSIMNQAYTEWECIVVNDGSTDNTEEVANFWVAIDDRFKYVYQKNSGLSAARNLGLEIARGDYIQFLDADDAIHPEKLSTQLQCFREFSLNKISISSYYASIANDLTVKHPSRFMSARFKTKNHFKDLILYWELCLSIPVHCFLFHGEFFNKYNIRFNEDLPNHEDWDCWMRIFALKPNVHYVDRPLAIYRIRDSSMSYQRVNMRNGFLKAIFLQADMYPKKSSIYRLLILKSIIVRVKYFLIALKDKLINTV
jgi:glycosyltransferase involved in cell wall biosynthesis